MSNFKSGSGNLDFGGNNTTKEEEDKAEIADTQSNEKRDVELKSTEANSSNSPAGAMSNTDGPLDRSQSSQEEYPYFIRRSNVGDERDTRLEIHLRDKVADQEAKFRNELADQLGANEVSKTDAREFALLAAFHNPEQVAELMKEEGFGTLG
jgi:hypothetical protein